MESAFWHIVRQNPSAWASGGCRRSVDREVHRVGVCGCSIDVSTGFIVALVAVAAMTGAGAGYN